MLVMPFCCRLLLLCAVWSAARSGVPAAPLPDAEESYAVYSALLREEIGSGAATILIVSSTKRGRDDPACLKPPAGADAAQYREQIGQYLERNRRSYRLLAKFDIGRAYKLVEDGPGSGEWPPSTMYIWLSAVGFNNNRDRAVVYMERLSGRLSGVGGARFLTKRGGKWTVDSQRLSWPCMWISQRHPSIEQPPHLTCFAAIRYPDLFGRGAAAISTRAGGSG